MLLILLLFTGIACSDDNDNDNNISKEAKAFVGEWNGNSAKASYSGDCKIQDNGNDSFAIVIYLTMGSNISDLKVIEGTYN
ncbi:MAG: hypothetical protein LUH15_06705 [Tannerellaceae bacterium]|nr:hypothetical protein [Tannerellaceae bacterium]